MEPINTDSIYSLADWSEFLVIHNQQELSKAKLASMLNVNRGSIDEEQIDSIFTELSRRHLLYGEYSPFKLNNDVLIPNLSWQDYPEYMMCLIFSLRGVEKRKGTNDGTKLFERLSREAIISYLSPTAEVIGFPNAQSLAKQIEDISKKTCERLGSRKVKPKDKDKGVDIIAWKSHGDLRDNQIVLLLQCGAGLHFGLKKPISLPAWCEFIQWSARPIPGIIIPIIVSIDDWIEVRDDYNLVFDRVRIYRALTGRDLADQSLRAEMLGWCKTKLNEQ